MTRPPRVLQVISSMSPERGGPTGAVRTIMKALSRQGIQADVVTTDDDGNTKRLSVLHDRFYDLDGQRLRYFPRQDVRYAASLPLARWVSRNVRDYDVVHTHGLFGLPPIAAAWHARRASVPYIMTTHGVLDSWGIKNRSPLIKAVSIRLVEAPLLRAAAAVHFISDLEASRAGELGLQMRPVVLPLGFDFSTESQASPEPIAALAGPGRKIILYLSRIDAVKRLDILLRAFAQLPARDSLILAIAGDGDPALVGSLKRLMYELGIEEHVRWLGYAEGGGKRWLLSQASVFVLPSASENFGVAIVEAMHAGVPVIVTRGAGLAPLVESARAGLVTDGSITGLKSALMQLLADEQLRRTSGSAGRAAVAEHLSLDVFGSRLETLYRSVARGSANPMISATPELR